MDQFSHFLFDLGEELEVPLHVDQHGGCSLLLNRSVSVQMQMDIAEEKLLLLCKVAELPPGRFRADVLFEALKSNSSSERVGYFSYIEPLNVLALCEELLTQGLTSQAAVLCLENLYKKATEWKEALDGGHAAPSSHHTGRPSSSIFGIK